MATQTVTPVFDTEQPRWKVGLETSSCSTAFLPGHAKRLLLAVHFDLQQLRALAGLGESLCEKQEDGFEQGALFAAIEQALGRLDTFEQAINVVAHLEERLAEPSAESAAT